jgi:hypothetical protein
MAIEAISAAEHCAVVFSWNEDAVDGDIVQIWANNPEQDDKFEFKKKLVNDGLGVVFFPPGYWGLCNLQVRSLTNDISEEGTLDIGDPEMAPE